MRDARFLVRLTERLGYRSDLRLGQLYSAPLGCTGVVILFIRRVKRKGDWLVDMCAK